MYQQTQKQINKSTFKGKAKGHNYRKTGTEKQTDRQIS